MAECAGEGKQQLKSGFPLVSVICLCYNHKNFVEEALASVLGQSYPNIEIIIVDDFSQDDSVKAIMKFLKDGSEISRYEIKTIFLSKNLGNCRAFNRGFAVAKGKYIIDFATDDVMLPERIEQQVRYFEKLSPNYGVIFTEAAYIDEKGQHLFYHYKDKLQDLQSRIPTGDVYVDLLKRYFICGPTMIVRKKVLEDLGGYDEELAYEDFDFWVRSSRQYYYAYLPVCTTKVRKHNTSMSTGWYKPGDPQLLSTYIVCRKAVHLNRTEEEKKALHKRIRFELRQSIFYNHPKEAKLFFDLLREQGGMTMLYKFLYLLFRLSLHMRSINL